MPLSVLCVLHIEGPAMLAGGLLSQDVSASVPVWVLVVVLRRGMRCSMF